MTTTEEKSPRWQAVNRGEGVVFAPPASDSGRLRRAGGASAGVVLSGGLRPFWAMIIYCVAAAAVVAPAARYAVTSYRRYRDLNRVPVDVWPGTTREEVPADDAPSFPDVSPEESSFVDDAGPEPLPMETAVSPEDEIPSSAVAPPAPGTVSFRLFAPAAGKVLLGGTFNGYRAQPMTRGPDGVWEASRDLAPGRYTYKFKVDGRWQLDPANPNVDPEGNKTSILEVK